MPNAFIDFDQTLLFLLIVVNLGACFIWAFWELEQMRERRRQDKKSRALRSRQGSGRVF
jgi:hypothetical protein